MSIIEFDDVSQAFFADRKKKTAKVALDHLSFSIDEGEFVSLLGPSGCGKTVSLSLMAGFASPLFGTVLFKGKPVEGPGPDRGVVFQEYSLFPWLSAKQNVVFSVRNACKASHIPLSREEAEKRAERALAVVGLADAVDARPNTLSGGMKQRVAIARLLAMERGRILLDRFSSLLRHMCSLPAQ